MDDRIGFPLPLDLVGAVGLAMEDRQAPDPGEHGQVLIEKEEVDLKVAQDRLVDVARDEVGQAPNVLVGLGRHVLNLVQAERQQSLDRRRCRRKNRPGRLRSRIGLRMRKVDKVGRVLPPAGRIVLACGLCRRALDNLDGVGVGVGGVVVVSLISDGRQVDQKRGGGPLAHLALVALVGQPFHPFVRWRNRCAT